MWYRMNMSEILRAYTEFDSLELARQLHEVVSNDANAQLLEARNIRGPIYRYGGEVHSAEDNVKKGQDEHTRGILSHYAILGVGGDVVGAASLYPNLPLHKLRAPVPAFIARRSAPLLARRFDFATPNVSAWADDNEGVLAQAYKELVKLSDTAPDYHPKKIDLPASQPPLKSVWTLEPARSPQDIHEAIVATSGLGKVATRRFDDGEQSRLEIPPRGTLYARLHSSWRTVWGAQKELTKGEHSLRVQDANFIEGSVRFAELLTSSNANE